MNESPEEPMILESGFLETDPYFLSNNCNSLSNFDLQYFSPLLIEDLGHKIRQKIRTLQMTNYSRVLMLNGVF